MEYKYMHILVAQESIKNIPLAKKKKKTSL